MSQSDVIVIIKNYLLGLKQAGITIDMAFLYGSYARNEASSESDIDLMLISRIFDTEDDAILALPWLYTAAYDPRIEPVSVGYNRYLTDDSSLLLEIVRKEGIQILA